MKGEGVESTDLLAAVDTGKGTLLRRAPLNAVNRILLKAAFAGHFPASPLHDSLCSFVLGSGKPTSDICGV